MTEPIEYNIHETVFDHTEIRKTIPHRAPFLMIDKIIHYEENKRVVALKTVSGNEPHFAGHFPHKPVMPGVLILEAMAQTGAILAAKSSQGPGPGKILYLVGADKVKWKRMVVPGDVLVINMIFNKRRGAFWFIEGVVTVGNDVVCSGEIMAMASDEPGI